MQFAIARWVGICLFLALATMTSAAVEFESSFDTYLHEKRSQHVWQIGQDLEAYKSLVKDSDCGILVLDSCQQLVYWNNASIYFDHTKLAQFEYSGVIRNPSGDIYFLEIQSSNEQIYSIFILIPLKFANWQNQKAFIESTFGTPFRQVDYKINDSARAATSEELLISWNKIPSAIWGNFNLFFFFLLLCFCYFLLLRKSNYLLQKFGRIEGTVIIILLMLAIRLTLSPDVLFSHIRYHPVFESVLTSSLLSSSIGDLFLNMLLFVVITLFLIKVYDFDNERLKQIEPGRYTLVSGYFIVLLAFILFVYIVKQLILNSNTEYHFDKIYILDWNTHLMIMSILLFISALFFLTYLFIKFLNGICATLERRLLSFFVSTLLTYPIFLYLDLNVSDFGFYVLALCLIFLMDLFVDTNKKSVSWLVIWLVTIASGTTALLHVQNQKVYALKATTYANEIAEQRERSGENEFDAVYNNPDRFDWAIYEGYLVTDQSEGVYPVTFPFEEFPAVGEIREQVSSLRNDLIYRYKPGITVLVGTARNALLQIISLFSFLFTSLSILALSILFLNAFLKIIPVSWNIHFTRKRTIRRRIQFSIFSILIISFAAVISITYFFLNQYNNDLYGNIYRNEQPNDPELISLEMDQIGKRLNEGVLIEEELLSNRRVFRYDQNGRLLNSINAGKQPLYRPPGSVIENNQSIEITSLRLDGLEYFIKPIRIAEEKQILALSGLIKSPKDNYFFNNLLGSLLNIYIFLFIIASSVALTFSDSITRPLTKLREKILSFKLGKSYEKLEWRSNDELGELINDYNRMLDQLEESAQTLAMTEREVAWREMAKQVAHEIKNPLTPMKLSLQHLQMTIKRDPERAKDLIDRASKILLEQIDNLADIASEFSSFAKMPKPQNMNVVLNDIASNVHDLFRKRDDMDINLYVPIDEIYVFADRNYMTRILINLLKNSIQAIPSGRRGIIDINVYKEEDNAVIKITDNGIGIPDEIKEKVFKPNFTSKNSGTGLGLAICANIVESFNGKIYFKSVVDEGTSFFIEIPLMHMEDNYKKEEHVIL